MWYPIFSQTHNFKGCSQHYRSRGSKLNQGVEYGKTTVYMSFVSLCISFIIIYCTYTWICLRNPQNTKHIPCRFSISGGFRIGIFFRHHLLQVKAYWVGATLNSRCSIPMFAGEIPIFAAEILRFFQQPDHQRGTKNQLLSTTAHHGHNAWGGHGTEN